MSNYWLTKGGDIQGSSYSGDVKTSSDVAILSARFEATQLDEVDVGDVTATLTAAQLASGILTSDPAAGAINLTTPTAALIVAEDGKAAVGRGFEFVIINEDGANAITVVAGVGVTAKGSLVVAASTSARFYVRYTNVTAAAEAVSIYRL